LAGSRVFAAQVLIRAKAMLEDTLGTLENWQSSSNPCGAVQWPGVVCTEDGFVKKVLLPSKGLSGAFPTEFLALEKLTELDLSENNISGALYEACEAAILKVRLQKQVLSSSMPLKSGCMCVAIKFPKHRIHKLESLSFKFFCAGTLPSNWSTADSTEQNYSNVQVLRLASNALVGTLPAAWNATFAKLEVLDLSNNQLSGTLPSSWDTMANLAVL
jgi:hypothetical protein